VIKPVDPCPPNTNLKDKDARSMRKATDKNPNRPWTLLCEAPLHALAAACLALLTQFSQVIADDLPGSARPSVIVSLQVSPSAIELSGQRAAAQILVSGIDAEGNAIDLTRTATISDSDILRIDEHSGYARPLKDGQATLVISACGKQAIVPVMVKHADTPQPVSFHWETLAVLTKQGCNSGSCHGKPNGRGALELSLNAFDPALDQRSLIRGAFVRFCEPLVPEESLLLKKPTLRIPHGGGKRLRPTDDQYGILHQWIYDGCPPDAPDAATCTGITVEPNDGRVLQLDRSATQQFRVAARFSDGTTRDVTRIATWTVSHEAVASIDANGLVAGLDRGQTAISVRYLDDLVSVPLTVVKNVPGFEWNDPSEANIIDKHVHQKLRQLQYLPSAICSDETFVRRLSLDVRGLLPTSAETRSFLADKATNKREKLIDKFLDSPEYAAFWSLKMSDLLRISQKSLSPEFAAAFSDWVRESITSNAPYDSFVTEMLTAKGLTSENPAASFFRVTDETKTVSETVTQLFMGSRIMCAQCHNHPYEKWTQNNYYQIAAAFHEVDRVPIEIELPALQNGKRQRKPDPKELDVRIDLTFGRGMSNPRTGVVQKPWPTDIKRADSEDRRVEFARWLTAKENPYFARVAVNRMWAHLLGRGLVEPIDDFRSSNPAVNTELLDELATEFERSNFDRKYILRLILNSHTWQRSSDANDSNRADETLFSHARIRLLSAEQIQDAITRLCDGPDRPTQLAFDRANLADRIKALTGTSSAAGANDKAIEELLDNKAKRKPKDIDTKIAELEKRIQAIQKQLDDYFMTQQPYPHLTTFLKAFGQPERTTACVCERREEVSLDQALQFMNSSLIRSRVSEGTRRLSVLKDEKLIEELYLAAFSRLPSETEQNTIGQYLQTASDRHQAIEDIIWSLINTNEFMFQH
jgi:hypothetical protein